MMIAKGLQATLPTSETAALMVQKAKDVGWVIESLYSREVGQKGFFAKTKGYIWLAWRNQQWDVIAIEDIETLENLDNRPLFAQPWPPVTLGFPSVEPPAECICPNHELAAIGCPSAKGKVCRSW